MLQTCYNEMSDAYEIGVDEPSRTTACNNFESAPRTEVFAVEGNPAYVLEFFTDFNLFWLNLIVSN